MTQTDSPQPISDFASSTQLHLLNIKPLIVCLQFIQMGDVKTASFIYKWIEDYQVYRKIYRLFIKKLRSSG